MQTKQNFMKRKFERERSWSNARTLNDRGSGLFCNHVKRVALLAAVFGIAGLATTGCASTAGGVTARLIDPVASDRQGSVSGHDDFYQRPWNPGFHDLTGS